MTVSGTSGGVVRTPESIAIERAMLVLQRQREAQKAQAQALVALVRQAGDVGRLIDVYA
jgi:hypothetical protein